MRGFSGTFRDSAKVRVDQADQFHAVVSDLSQGGYFGTEPVFCILALGDVAAPL